MSAWINGRRARSIDYRDRGLNYGDGVFETMRVAGGEVRLLELHLARLTGACRRLGIALPPLRTLRREAAAAAAQRHRGVLKLLLTRGIGARGYRPSGTERSTRIMSLHPLPSAPSDAGVEVRICRTPLSVNPRLAGLKTLNRLDVVLARAEWHDPRIWEGLMQDVDGHFVCGTMTNVFLRRGALLITPLLDRCGVAGVMRRWVLEKATALPLRVVERRVRWSDLERAEEMFLTNAVAGIVSIGCVRDRRRRIALHSRHLGDLMRRVLEQP